MSKKTLFNSDITKEEFLKNYWNKRPYLFKNAFQDTASLAEPDDFLDLAMDESCETRLVYKDENAKRKLVHGPFTQQQLSDYTKKSFALIGHNLNTLSPDFYDFQEAVDFIPGWEFDDVMSVYSNDEMSLGAHIDNYNVFIFQGQGRRKWEIELAPNRQWREDEEIKVLQEFNPDFEWSLEPGDMIYVPPGVAHHGTSLSESISYSIGFKSLETNDTLSSFFNSFEESDFFSNEQFNTKSKSDVPSELFAFFKERAKELLSDEDVFDTWLLKSLSAPKCPIEATGEQTPNSYLDLTLERDVHLKYAHQADKGITAINRKLYMLTDKQLGLLLPILDSNPFDSFEITEEQQIELREVLDDLWNSGAIFIQAD
ncbi:MAG: hypothetical protein KC478_01660 [Bacteriovoracaceae bacterium]|nr:hypothetical protein [Bacteriovoracaceae bacterium]